MKKTICVRIKETIEPQSFLNDKFLFISFVFHWPMEEQNEWCCPITPLVDLVRFDVWSHEVQKHTPEPTPTA
jgi:hypothetical protein